MKQMTLFSLAISLLLFSSGYSAVARSSSDVDIHIPVSCRDTNNSSSCGKNVTLKQVVDRHADFLKTKEQRLSQCDQKTENCLPLLLNPKLYTNTCNSIYPGDYSWAPSSESKNGSRTLHQLLKRAETGRSFKDGNKNLIVLEVLGSDVEERHLAVCSVTEVQGKRGPPKDCAVVAIITSSVTWLRGSSEPEDRFGESCPAAYSERLGPAIDIYFDIDTRNDMSNFASSILSILRNRFKLSAERKINSDDIGEVQSIEIISTSGIRLSEVLRGGWRETLDFDILLSEGRGKVNLHGVLHALICRQAGGSFADYRGLNKLEEDHYSKVYDGGINDAIRLACKKTYKQMDDRNIFCDQ